MAGKVREGLIVTIGATVGTALAANANRVFLSITNTHASQVLYVRFAAGATTAIGIAIAAGVTLTWGQGPNGDRACPGSIVTVIGSGSATTFYAFEHDGVMTGAE